MTDEQPNDQLHGITLKEILIKLEDLYGWKGLASRIRVNCFIKDPTMNSSLKLLRKTPWAREKVEKLYISTFVNPRTRKRK